MHVSGRIKLLSDDGGSERARLATPRPPGLVGHLGRGEDFIPATMTRRNTRRGAALREFADNHSRIDFDRFSLDTVVRNLHTRGTLPCAHA